MAPAAGQGQRRGSAPECFQGGERPGVSQPITEGKHGQVVGAVLALDADLVRDPPDCRMIEQHCLHRRLQQVDHVIVTADVSQLVRQQCFQLRGRHAADSACGHEDRCPQPAEGERHLHLGGLQEPHRAMDSEPASQLLCMGGQLAGDRARMAVGEALYDNPTTQQPQGEREHADQPCGHQGGEEALGVREWGRDRISREGKVMGAACAGLFRRSRRSVSWGRRH